jgi:hypothetical protein
MRFGSYNIHTQFWPLPYQNSTHLNVGKRRTVQYGLLNDEALKDYVALVVLEPYIFKYP